MAKIEYKESNACTEYGLVSVRPVLIDVPAPASTSAFQSILTPSKPPQIESLRTLNDPNYRRGHTHINGGPDPGSGGQPHAHSPPIPQTEVGQNSYIPELSSTDRIPVTELQVTGRPPLDFPTVLNVADILPVEATVFGETGAPRLPMELDETRREQALVQLTRKIATSDNIGFIDDCGYVVATKYEKDVINPDSGDITHQYGVADTTGEATYYTAIAVIALATGNYVQQPWDIVNANDNIIKFLRVLEDKSWGNQDSAGTLHPIRHPQLFDYDKNKVKIQQRPLTKDSFGPILAACYYAFNCPNSSAAVRDQCRSLLKKWIAYLESHKYTLHTESFDTEFSGGTFDSAGKPQSKLSEIDFVLLPADLVALKNCASALDLKTSVNPWIDSTITIWAELTTPLAIDCGKMARKGLSYVLDHFVVKLSKGHELIPRWPSSKVPINVSLGIPRAFRDRIEEVFEFTVRTYCEALFLGPAVLGPQGDKILIAAVDAITGLFPTNWDFFPIGPVLMDLLKQIMPWLDGEILSELYAFSGTLLYSVVSKKPAFVGYFVWTVAVEMETQRAIIPLLAPIVSLYFVGIKAEGNPCGLWAWLCHEDEIVAGQLQTFEGEVPSHWKTYAWETAYDKWVKDNVNPDQDTRGPPCSRLDYLVLCGLAEKGAPKWDPVALNLQVLLNGLETMLGAIIQDAENFFAKLGRYEKVYLDAVGATVRDIIKIEGEFTREIWREGKQASKILHSLEGNVLQQWRWTANEVIADYSKWTDTLDLELVEAENLVELQIRQLDGVLHAWTWDKANKALESFRAFVGTPTVGDLLVGAEEVTRVFRDAAGALSQIRWQKGVYQAHTQWRKSTREALADAEDCIIHSVRDPSGQLRQWRYGADHALEKFGHWLTSDANGVSSSAVVLNAAIRGAAGDLQVAFYNGAGNFLSRLDWSISSPFGSVHEVDCVLYQLRSLDTSFEEWHFDHNVPQKYLKWKVSTPDGRALGNDLVKSVERQLDGTFVSWSFANGAAKVGQVLTGIGRVVKNIGGAVVEAVDAIGGIFSGVHW